MPFDFGLIYFLHLKPSRVTLNSLPYGNINLILMLVSCGSQSPPLFFADLSLI